MILPKAMAPQSSTLAWKIPWTEEPGRLQSMGLWRVGHDWATSLSLFTFMHWRRKWQPTPVLLPGESQGRWSLMGCRLWGRKESDMTERLNWTELIVLSIYSVALSLSSPCDIHIYICWYITITGYYAIFLFKSWIKANWNWSNRRWQEWTLIF